MIYNRLSNTLTVVQKNVIADGHLLILRFLNQIGALRFFNRRNNITVIRVNRNSRSDGILFCEFESETAANERSLNSHFQFPLINFYYKYIIFNGKTIFRRFLWEKTHWGIRCLVCGYLSLVIHREKCLLMDHNSVNFDIFGYVIIKNTLCPS